MTPIQKYRRVQARPRRLSSVLALLVFAAGFIVAACGGSGATPGTGEQTAAPGETNGMESAAPSSGY